MNENLNVTEPSQDRLRDTAESPPPMNENLNAPEPGQDHLRDTAESPPRDPPNEPNDAEDNTSDEAPQQHTVTTTDSGTGLPEEPLNDEVL
jgi:hypothetical protein